ncbi:MAG TPA: methyl-accepting chemotaxis protein [Aquabacterium sp.]|nr:methyl-accepting chemotaxis protein [Aquabacterium sp.]
MKLDNIRVANKLWGSILGLLFIMLAGSAFIQNRASVAMIHSLGDVQAHEAAISRAIRWRGLTELVVERTMARFHVPDAEADKMLAQRSAANSAEITELQKQVAADLKTDADKQAYEKVQQSRTAAVSLLKRVPELKAAGDQAALDTFLKQEFQPAAATLSESLEAFVKLQETQRDNVIQAFHDTRLRLAITGIIIAALLFVAAIVLITVLVRSIVQPLQQAMSVAKAIGAGDLTQRLDTNRHDEFGQLMQAFAEMTDRLKSLVVQVRTGVESVSTASVQIANGNQDLSSRTEQTAANLQQTAASMEQLTSNLTQSADTASQANQLAVNATQAAKRGGEVVSQVVSSMQHISDSSRRIADIIGVIDGIAFQTNILALNAAVEAARAGEQGRGFAVVASEVRNLAHRSAEAAKEIKSLIQNSVETVDTGAQQVSEAGSAMSDIVVGVQRVSDLIAEITFAATEQRQGIGQVNQAVGNLDQMTQQNAALVEESAAAASALSDQARKLAEVVAVFQVGHDARSVSSLSALSPASKPAPAPRPAPVTPRVQAPAARAAVAPKAVPAAPALVRPAMASAPAPAAAKLAAPASSSDDQDWETF